MVLGIVGSETDARDHLAQPGVHQVRDVHFRMLKYEFTFLSRVHIEGVDGVLIPPPVGGHVQVLVVEGEEAR